MGSKIEISMPTMMDFDKDELFICPYDPVHRVSANRFVRHILKCRKNHPLAEKAVCPFNARHVVPKPELRHHLSCCPDSRMIELEVNYHRYGCDGDELKGNTAVPPYESAVLDFGNDEDWDKEEMDEERFQDSESGTFTGCGKKNRRREAIKRMKEKMKQEEEERCSLFPEDPHQRRPLHCPGVADRQNWQGAVAISRMAENISSLNVMGYASSSFKPYLAANFQNKPFLLEAQTEN